MKKVNRIMCAAVLLASLFSFLFVGNVAEGGTVKVKVQQETTDQVQLVQNDGNIEVSVVVDRASEQQTTAVSLKLKVSVEQGKESVSFDFANKLSSAVTGSRYQNGYLYLYVSDDSGIFDQTDKVVLGNLQVNAKSASEGLRATVSYVKGSFRTVNAAYGELSVSGATDNGSVTVNQDGKQQSTTGSGDSSNKTDDAANEKTDSDKKADSAGKTETEEEPTSENSKGSSKKDKTDKDEEESAADDDNKDTDKKADKDDTDGSGEAADEKAAKQDKGTDSDISVTKAGKTKKYVVCAVVAAGALSLLGCGVYVWKKRSKK